MTSTGRATRKRALKKEGNAMVTVNGPPSPEIQCTGCIAITVQFVHQGGELLLKLGFGTSLGQTLHDPLTS